MNPPKPITHRDGIRGPNPLARHEAEDCLVGLIMLHPAEALDRCVERGLLPESFYHPGNRDIVATAIELQRRGVLPTSDVVREELIRSKRWDPQHGNEAFERLMDRDSPLESMDYFIGQVSDMHILRRLHGTASAIATEAAAVPEDVRGFVDRAESRMLAAAEERAGNTVVTSQTAVNEAALMIRHFIDTKGAATGQLTGYKALDDLTFGFEAGDMIVIAARPSMGKSTLALNFSENVAMGHHKVGSGPVLFFSLEMSKKQLGMKMLAAQMRVPLNRLRAGLVEQRDVDRAQKQLDASEMHIDDTAGLTVLEMKARARRLHQRKKLKLIVIDYLQLISATDSKAPREQQVAEISKSLKGFAKEMNVPVIILAQLNRESDKDRRRPRLSDLRESGSIEQDADVVLLLSRDPVSNDDSSVAGDYIVVDVAKQRMGEVGDLTLRFNRHFSHFDSLNAHDTEFLNSSRGRPTPPPAAKSKPGARPADRWDLAGY